MKLFTYSLIFAASFFTSCNSSTTTTETPETVTTRNDTAASVSDSSLATYQCPMKCQGDTTYAVAGQCPVCGMDLEKL